MNNNYIITYQNKCYAFDIDALKKICLISDTQKGKETEITETYTKNIDGVLEISSKGTKEVKGMGNPQNDMIIYDIVKLLITALLTNNSSISPLSLLTDEEDVMEEDITMDFATALAFNTCFKCGILVEVK